MKKAGRIVNIALGGGGVRGIAYIGAFDVMEKRGYLPGKIAGVSAGSLAGAFAAAGYDSAGMFEAMSRFDFNGIQIDKLSYKVPAIGRFIEYIASHGSKDKPDVVEFLASGLQTGFLRNNEGRKPGILKSLAALGKEGCLFDGDLLEEWVSQTLAVKGIRTFGDLRNGRKDRLNPEGYKIRMTGVDCNRVKVVVLPDDLPFYGLDPDKFEVAKAVRISTAVPFAFKPVELVRNEGGKSKVYNLVDGGVLDPFPGWLLPTDEKGLGYRLNSSESKLLGIDTPLNILKSLISSVHDIGVQRRISEVGPGGESPNLSIGEIDTGNVGFLDFDLTAADKLFLYNSGKRAASKLLDNLEINNREVFVNLPYGFLRGQKWQKRLHS